MGQQVRRAGPSWFAVLALAAATPALAEPTQALGVDVFASSDADHTDITKVALSFDWRRDGAERYDGVRLETARFRPLGQDETKDTRLYYRFADKSRTWAWNGQVGTDGHTALGSLDVHNGARFRQEYFLERDIVETPQGLNRRIYYTFAGGALDLPAGDRDVMTVVGAMQDFTGRNVRLHLRGNYVHTLQADWGLSAQVRARYFHSSTPGEFDYFSPRNFAQVVPTLQLRRRVAGWRCLVAAGLGAQRQTGGTWHVARAFNAQITSPVVDKAWAFDAAFAYSNTPTGAGDTYDYRQFSLGVRRAF